MTLTDWEHDYPHLFAVHDGLLPEPPEQTGGLLWDEVLAAIPDGPDRDDLVRLRDLLSAHPVSLRIVAGAVVLDAPLAWQAAHGPAFAHAVLLVHDIARDAVRRWLLPQLQR